MLGRARVAIAGPEAGGIHKLDRLDYDVRKVILEHAGRQETGLPTVATRRSGDMEIVFLMGITRDNAKKATDLADVILSYLYVIKLLGLDTAVTIRHNDQ